MPEIKQGGVTAVLEDSIKIPERAGELSIKEVQRLAKARRSVGSVATQTAEQLKKLGSRVAVQGLTPDALADSGRIADAIDVHVTDAQAVTNVLVQANLIADAEAHTNLRRVLAAVRAAEKFDPRIVDSFPALIEYWANTKAEDEPELPPK